LSSNASLRPVLIIRGGNETVSNLAWGTATDRVAFTPASMSAVAGSGGRAPLLIVARLLFRAVLGIVVLIAIISRAPKGWSQTAHFSGGQSALPAIALNYPYGIAVHGDGDVYIAGAGNNRVLKEALSAGSYVEGTLASSGLSNHVGVAVDADGNIYIVDQGNGRVLKEALNKISYSESMIVSGLSAHPRIDLLWISEDGLSATPWNMSHGQPFCSSQRIAVLTFPADVFRYRLPGIQPVRDNGSGL
jgi:hypothetical protein